MNQDSCVASAKIFDLVYIPLLGHLRYQEINLVLQLDKDLEGWPIEAKV